MKRSALRTHRRTGSIDISRDASASSQAAVGSTKVGILVGFTVMAAVFGSRFDVAVPGLDADVSLVNILAPLMALVALLWVGPSRSLGFLQSSAFVLMVGPFMALGLALPWLAVFFNGYEVTALYALTVVTTGLSFLVIGASVSGAGLRPWSAWLALAILLQFIYALAQAVWLGSGPIADFLGPVIEWDLAIIGDDIIWGRSSGLYTNPNVLGYWAAAATMLALTMVSPTVRPIALAMALLTLVLSQSRGATVALLAAIAMGTIASLVIGRVPRSQLRAAALAVLLLVVVAPVVVLVLPAQTFERFDALADVVTQGAEADRNLAGRVDFWVAATDLSVQYPLGTWGNPEVALGTAVDSEWFRAFARGSVLLVGAVILLLLAPVGVGSYPGRYALWLLAIVIAVAGLTQTPMSYPPVVLYFALLGGGLQWAVDNRIRRAPLGDPRARGLRRNAAHQRYG